MPPELQKRFWAKVHKSRGCWEWQACVNEKGYGIFGLQNKRIDRAHRISFRLKKGPIPEGLFVCHKCDNPKCVRPSHLFLGTNADNVRDMFNKGRNSPPPPMGGWNRYEYTEDVIARFGKEPDTAIARDVGVSKHAISRERKRRGIKSFPCPTLFKSGGPHPCWSRRGKVRNEPRSQA